jgi:hypothetical protein
MPKGKAKILFDYKKDTCPHLYQLSWCGLPRDKRCGACINVDTKTRACEIML